MDYRSRARSGAKRHRNIIVDKRRKPQTQTFGAYIIELIRTLKTLGTLIVTLSRNQAESMTPFRLRKKVGVNIALISNKSERDCQWKG